MRSLTAVIAATLVAACATTPTPTGDSAEVPSSRMLAPQFLTNDEGRGTVVVKRDRGMMGAACSMRLYVDGTSAADLYTQEKVTLRLPAGQHVLSVAPNGLCGGGIREAGVDVLLGKVSMFRIGYLESGDLHISPTAF